MMTRMRESAPAAKGSGDATSRNLGPIFKLNTVHCNTTVARQDFIMSVVLFIHARNKICYEQAIPMHCMGIFSSADSAAIMTYKFFKASLKCWSSFLPGWATSKGVPAIAMYLWSHLWCYLPIVKVHSDRSTSQRCCHFQVDWHLVHKWKQADNVP